jgi:hypothetical protein
MELDTPPNETGPATPPDTSDTADSLWAQRADLLDQERHLRGVMYEEGKTIKAALDVVAVEDDIMKIEQKLRALGQLPTAEAAEEL